MLNLHSSMRKAVNFDWALYGVLSLYVSIMIVFSSIVYCSYGDAINDQVTLNLPHDSLTSTLKILYSIGLLGSYPI